MKFLSSFIHYSLPIAVLLLLTYCTPKSGKQAAKIEVSDTLNPWTKLEWNNDPTNFQFVIVTDRTGGLRPGVFEKGAEKVNLLQPEFVMSVGDLITGYTEDEAEINRQWEEFDSYVESLDMPFFYVVGNHDITNKVMEDIWKQRLGRTYYHFVYHDVLFLCLNSEEGLDAHRSSFFSEDQRAYIKQALDENPDVRWTLVFLHKPVWLSEGHLGGDKPEDPSGWKEIEGMLQGRKHTVYAGHIHRYTHDTHENNNYITLATTGGGSRLRGPIFGEFDHVMWVTMTDDGPIMANLLLNGIWDEEIDKGDIEDYLKMEVQRKVVNIGTPLEVETFPKSQTLELKLFNGQEVPMEVNVTLENSEHFQFGQENIQMTISPNSLELVKVSLSLNGANDISSEDLRKELDQLPAQWEVTYDFKDYGEIVINGSKDLF